MKNNILIPVAGNERIYEGFIKVAKEILSRKELNHTQAVGVQILPSEVKSA
ncbi:MAG: hypothetical protein LBC82_05160 [Oscillospiraceae bacterium]|jgi:hypothetical protein|nr:hypothetical protein [Oscillospiraceae bacterium]